MLKQDVIDRIIHYYGNKYNYDLIPDNCKSKEMLHIICPLHGEFTVRIDYLGNTDEICPECRKILKLLKNFLKVKEKAFELFGDNLDFSESIYTLRKVPIKVKCNKCGQYFDIRVDHLFDKGRFPCPNCGKQKRFKEEDLKLLFIEKCILKFGDIYDFSKTKYKDCKTETTIICPKHGEIKIIPYLFLRTSGCSLCTKEKRSEKLKMTFELFIERARRFHGNRYDYSNATYIDYYTPIKIFDTQLKLYFFLKPNIHANGKGNPFILSKGNARINDWLIEHNIKFTQEFLIRDMLINGIQHNVYVDFMVELNNKKYFIEYNGILHYEMQEYFGEEKFNYQLYRDEWLRTYSKNNNYILIEIPYTVNTYKDISDFLEKIFNTNEIDCK